MWSTAGRPKQELAQLHADTVVPAPRQVAGARSLQSHICRNARHDPLIVSCAPFKLLARNDSVEMEILGGFLGITQKHKTMELQPEIGWAVRERESASDT
jgi:hypothetical protein